MRRVQIKHVGQLTDEQLASRLATEDQVLCVVNTRRHAADLFAALPEDEGSFHLSALMCPRHRSAVLRLIKCRLRARRTCRVVSTQLIEAGVDIDFPVVYRAMTGIDSIAQAAGRCNREGRLKTGRTFVFDTEQQPRFGSLRQMVDTAKELIGLYPDLLSLDAVEHYFQLHYWKKKDTWDRKGVMDCFKLSNDGLPLCDFARADAAYRIIADDTEPVIIPWGVRGKALVEQLKNDPFPSRDLRRALQRYTVQVRKRLLDALHAKGTLNSTIDPYHILLPSVLSDYYRSDTGLSSGDDILNSC